MKCRLTPRRLISFAALVSCVGVVAYERISSLSPKPPPSVTWPPWPLDFWELWAPEQYTLPLVEAISTFSVLPHSLRPTPLPDSLLADSNRSSALVHAQIFEAATPLPQSSRNAPAPPTLTVGVVGSHEGDFLVEWLTWHRLTGVGRFIVFDVVEGGDKGTRGDGWSLKDVLRPWREEGSVVLIEVEWTNGKPSGWQRELLKLMEQHLFQRLDWFGHWDVDEFLFPRVGRYTVSGSLRFELAMPTAPASRRGRRPRHHDWRFSLHESLLELEAAACVPLPRYNWENVGHEILNEDEDQLRQDGWRTVIKTHVWHTAGRIAPADYGKALAHPAYREHVAYFGSQHLCQPYDSEKDPTLHPYDGKVLHNFVKGQADLLRDYLQRSLADCRFKLANLAASNITNWRTRSGDGGCLRRLVPRWPSTTIVEARERLEATGEAIHVRERDDRVRESWEGRVTRVLVDYWWLKEEARWRWIEPGVERPDDRVGVFKLLL